MNKKEHLISSLKIAINALRNDTIFYDWQKQQSCNAGIVSQAVLGKSADEIEELRAPLFDVVNKLSKETNKEISATWKNAIKYSCPLTGKNMPQIVLDLESAGIGREDIVHLEFLENPAILALSGIEKEEIRADVEVGGDYQMIKQPHSNTLFAFFGIKTIVQKYVPIYESQVVGSEYPNNYYAEKENLIKYLVAWVSILEGESSDSFETDVNKLEAQLLNAVAEENYEVASNLRDKIANLTCK